MICMYVFICMYACIFIKLHITAQSGPVMYVCMYVCMYLRMYVCIY